MMQNTALTMVLTFALLAWLPGCKKTEPPATTDATPAATTERTAEGRGVQPPAIEPPADGSEHADQEGKDKPGEGQDHAHDEVPLGTITIGEMEVEFAQGHGKVEAGKESHLVVKLPYNDKGTTMVRAWLGTEDRTMSLVAKAEYAPSHDDYDVHALAPDPLPKNLMWWIEIEKPDGTKALGTAKPLVD